VRRFVYASSSSVYGNSAEREKVETLPTAPLSPYATSKLTGENYTLVFHAVDGLATVALRYFNVFGPRQDPHSAYAAVIPLFVKHLLEGKSAPIYGDGEQTRDFTYVENVVNANLLACAADEEACGRAYNIACAQTVTVNRLYRLLCQRLDAPVEPRYLPPRRGEVRRSLARIELARQRLGYQPVYTLEAGLDETLAWYRTNRRESHLVSRT
jgi:nucleoside-diphosphate-sugar epimerase